MMYPQISAIILTISLGSANSGVARNGIVDGKRATMEFLGFAGNKAFLRDAASEAIPFGDYINFCHANDLKVASIENEEEMLVVSNYISDTPYLRMLWLGGWDPIFSMKWTWINSNEKFNYTNWSEWYPTGGKACSAISYNFPGEWIDTSCENMFVPLCQLTL